MEYIRIVKDTKKLGLKESHITIYPFVCMHFGAAQCDMKFIKEQVERVKNDPNGLAVYLGDAGECVTKLSKGDIFTQLLNPQGQMDCAVDVLTPIKDKLILGVSGNHGHRIFKETGLDFDKNLCLRLGMPYLGLSALCNLVVNRSSYDIFFHHGSASGSSLQSKVTAAEHFTRFINTDALFTAHSHVAMELQPSAVFEADNVARVIRTKLRHQYICGSGYDSRTGYAEDKAYPPILPSYISVKFDGRIVEGKARYSQEYKRYISDGQHKLEHEYVSKYTIGELKRRG